MLTTPLHKGGGGLDTESVLAEFDIVDDAGCPVGSRKESVDGRDAVGGAVVRTSIREQAAVDASALWSRRPGQDECPARYSRPAEQKNLGKSISEPAVQACTDTRAIVNGK